jgi:hypothetical protein
MQPREIQITSGTIHQAIVRIKKHCAARRLIVTTAKELADVAAAGESRPVNLDDSADPNYRRPPATR